MKDNGHQNQVAAESGNREPVTHANRRAHDRHPFSALAGVIEPRTRTRLNCRATDLSFGGIYVDTISPFAVGTAVLVRLSCEGRSFQAGAKVTYSLNGMGMGLAFVPELPAEQTAALHSWITELSDGLREGPPMDFDTPLAASRPSEHASAAEDSEKLREVTRGLLDILLHKQILTESEASTLRGKLVR